ncbi:MAG: hypothetical protein OEY44_01190 [Candidatus Peregrinibacteria bacterium]|nr:hypothetical protein [Candidatus Peregrinibacteria bacterium]
MTNKNKTQETRENQGAEVLAERADVGIVRSVHEKVATTFSPLAAVQEKYGYSPFPESEERVDLGIQWESTNEAYSPGQLNYEFDENSEGVHTRGNERVRFVGRDLFKRTLEASQAQPLKLSATMNIRTDLATQKKEETFILGLDNPNADEDDFNHYGVANFAFRKIEHDDRTEWDLNDRIVSPVYRSQGIASKMLNSMEGIIKQYANETGKSQEISAQIGQASVLFWFLKNGFVAATPEDQAKIDRFISGDPSLTIVSAPSDENADEERQWFIFEKATLLDESGEQNPEIWNNKNYGQPIHYMNSSFRINLKKVL